MKNKFLDELQNELLLSEDKIIRLILRSPHTYKIYTIPKKTGGERVIAQPAKETKYMQNWLIKNIFNKLPIHSCASAYKKGASIKVNASAHVNSSYMSKFDFKDFFTSIKAIDLQKHLACYLKDDYSLEEIAYIARISCIQYKGRNEQCLSIGAPSSPILSNSIMYDFDEKINCWCQTKNIIYTRYADDLTFSTNESGTKFDIQQKIIDVIKELKYPILTINDKKTIHLSKKNQRRVTGIIINNEGKISLGRDRKRLISSLIHKFKIRTLDSKLYPKLQGLLAFSLDVEPMFFSSMRKKYGESVLDTIMRERSHTYVNSILSKKIQ